IKLQEQPARVLALLLLNKGNLVTREQMRGHLWPDDTFVDFEHGLNTAIKKLRESLEDSADRPNYIETLPKKGYRFIAAVSVRSTSGLEWAAPTNHAARANTNVAYSAETHGNGDRQSQTVGDAKAEPGIFPPGGEPTSKEVVRMLPPNPSAERHRLSRWWLV